MLCVRNNFGEPLMRTHLKRRMHLRIGLLALLLTAVFSSSAQDFRATLTGLVTDPSGATVPGAKVTAVNSASGTSYKATTGAGGNYFIPYVLPGMYTVSVDAKGFKTSVQDKVLLQNSTTFNQNFKLTVGSIDQQVVVTTAPPLLETSTGSGGTVIDSREIQNVPLNGGQSYMLIGTTPGSQFTTTSFGPGVGNSGTRGWDVTNSYTVGGGIVGNNQFTLNGTNITSQTAYGNHSAGEWTVSPNIDSISEVNVMTQTYDARYGRTSGGTINVSTQGGGEQYHGSVHYSYEGGFMNANTFQNNLTGTPRNGEVQNQFWITGGGPIIRHKLFGFFAFEGYRQSLAGTTEENVPPAFLRPGFNGNPGVDFGLIGVMDASQFPMGNPIFQPGTAYCLDGGPVTACNSNHVAQQEFANDTIPANQINPTAVGVLKYIPLPNIPGAQNAVTGANFIGQTPDLYDYNQPQVRVDYNLSDRTKLYSYFLYWHGTEFRSNNGLSGVAANGNINWVHQNWVATQDVSHVFSPTLIGDFKVSFNRFLEVSPDGDLSTQTAPSTIGLGLPLPPTTTGQFLPEFKIDNDWNYGIVNGGTVFGNESNLDVTNNFTLDADLTKTRGAHTFEFGGEVDEFQYGNPGNVGHANGDFEFNSSWTQLNPHLNSCYPIAPSGGNSNQCNAQLPMGGTPQNGSSLASFYLGNPSSGGIDWNKTIFEGQPVWAIYFQDNWRVSPRLTLNFGMRYDVQRGLRERNNELNRGVCLTCVNPIGTTSAYQANVASGANQAAWAAAGISPASLDEVLGGIQFAGTDGQSRDAYDTDWSNVGPRFGFAFAINSKTVVRGGYGVTYSYGLEGGSSVGEYQTTNYTSSLDGGNTPTNYFQTGSPFASGLVAPTGNSLGLETDLGNGGVSVDFPNRKIPREQLVSFGMQREVPGGFVLDASYAGNFSSRLRVDGTSPLWINGTATLAQLHAAIANPQVFNQQVPNPYYGVPGISGPGQCGTGTTVSAVTLLLPLSQYCSPGGAGLVGANNIPLGRNWYDGLEVKLTRKVTNSAGRGLSMNVAYTYSKTINGDGYQNGWPYQDAFQIHWLAGTDRTHVFSATSVWDLPVGKKGLIFTSPNPVVGTLINDWTLSGVFNMQSGVPVGLNTGSYYNCPTTSYRPSNGTSVLQGHWFNANADCYSQIPTYGLSNLEGNTDQVRQPTIPTLDLSLQKTTPIHENWVFTLRLDAFNSLNSVLFPGPNTNFQSGAAQYVAGSGWTGFGTVNEVQQNFPRVLQIGGKINF
jgi:Carboxypeptidase regulatory-like domain